MFVGFNLAGRVGIEIGKQRNRNDWRRRPSVQIPLSRRMQPAHQMSSRSLRLRFERTAACSDTVLSPHRQRRRSQSSAPIQPVTLLYARMCYAGKFCNTATSLLPVLVATTRLDSEREASAASQSAISKSVTCCDFLMLRVGTRLHGTLGTATLAGKVGTTTLRGDVVGGVHVASAGYREVWSRCFSDLDS